MKGNRPLPWDVGTLVLFLQFLAHTIQLKISPSARELFLLVRTHNMPNKGQGFLEKCSVAKKIEQQEDDAGGPASVPGDDMGAKKISSLGASKEMAAVTS